MFIRRKKLIRNGDCGYHANCNFVRGYGVNIPPSSYGFLFSFLFHRYHYKGHIMFDYFKHRRIRKLTMNNLYRMKWVNIDLPATDMDSCIKEFTAVGNNMLLPNMRLTIYELYTTQNGEIREDTADKIISLIELLKPIKHNIKSAKDDKTKRVYQYQLNTIVNLLTVIDSYLKS